MIKTVVTGYVSDDAKAFLQLHQVPISQHLGLSIIALDEEVGVVNAGEKPGEYIIAFWVDDDSVDVLEDCIIVALSIDASETKVILRKDYWTAFLNMSRLS